MMFPFLRKHGTLLGLTLAVTIYFIAVSLYPGGSENDQLSKGYHWQTNYFCNLTSTKALNGDKNPVYVLAIAGMMILAASIAFFYYNHSQKIHHQTYSAIVKYCGLASMISVALVFTSHNLFTTIGVTFSMVTIFIILIFLFKDHSNFLKWFGVFNLILLYATAYVYYTQQFINILAIMQKVSFLATISWMLCLQYFINRKTNFKKGISN